LDPTTLFVVALFLLVACAVLAGELVSRFGQAALVGQLAVGVVLGPTLLGPFLGLTGVTTELNGLEILATFFVLMTAGLAVTPEQLVATGVRAGAFGVVIFAVPFAAGTFVVRLLYPGLPGATDLFVALTLSVTALPVLGILLAELNLLHGRLGTSLLNGALVNELAAVSTFSVLLRVTSGSGEPLGLSVAIGVTTVALFFTAILSVHSGLRSLRRLHVWERWVRGVRLNWRSREAGFALLMVGGLAAALLSQALGLTFLVGAFYAGLLITPQSAGASEHRRITRVFDAVTWGFFVPLFFALVGFGMNLRFLASSPEFFLAFVALVLFAFASKALVGAAAARALIGARGREAVGAGYLVASRGAVELAMAIILLSTGVFDTSTFTIVAGVGLVTTFLSPLGARPNFARGRAPPPSPGARAAPPAWLDGALPRARTTDEADLAGFGPS
jgi:Kef-type K+ transport system membrane component KefB